jgi:UDP-N-acetylmuramate--alanine ligase
MEYFGNEENIEREFQHFIEKATRTRILCVDCPRVRKMADNILNRNKITCGFHNSADIRCVNVKYTENGSYYDVIDGKSGDTLMGSLYLPLHGQHNVQNALVLVALARELNISDETLREALKTFTGVERRFTITGKVNGITVVDDYAHHPSEIEAVLEAARKITSGKLFAVLQPHRYSRLSRLFPQFSTCFGQSADQVLLLPVYSAGETNTLGVSSEILAASITPTTTTKVFHFQTVEAASKHLCEVCLPQDMIVFMGAGDITYLANDFPEISKKYYAEKSCVEKQ